MQTDPYGIPQNQQTMVPYTQYMSQPMQQQSLQPYQYSYLPQQPVQYIQDFQNTQHHISNQIQQLQNQYNDYSAKLSALGPSFNTQLQNRFTDFNNQFGNQYQSMQQQFQQQQLQQQQDNYNSYLQSLQSNQSQLQAQNTQFHTSLKSTIDHSFSQYKSFISELLTNHANIFVNGFKTYYDETTGFLNNKLESLSRELELCSTADRPQVSALTNAISNIRTNIGSVEKLQTFLIKDLSRISSLQNELATQASQNNVENTDKVVNMLNYLFQQLAEKQSILQNSLSVEHRLQNQSNVPSALSTFMKDLKSEMLDITNYISTTFDSISRQRDDKFEQAFNVKISDLSTHLDNVVTQLNSSDILNHAPVNQNNLSPGHSITSQGNNKQGSSHASQTNKYVPPVHTSYQVQPALPQVPTYVPPVQQPQQPQLQQSIPQQVHSQPQQTYAYQPPPPTVQQQNSYPPGFPPPMVQQSNSFPPGFPQPSYGVNQSNQQNSSALYPCFNTPQVLTNNHQGLPTYDGSTPLQPWLRRLERDIQSSQYCDHQAFLLAQSKFKGDVALWADQNDSLFVAYHHPTHTLLNQYSYVTLKQHLVSSFSRSQEDFLEGIEKVHQHPTESFRKYMRRLQKESQHGYVSLSYLKSLFLRNMHDRNIAVLLKGDAKDSKVNMHQLVKEAEKVQNDIGTSYKTDKSKQPRSRSQSYSSRSFSRSNRSLSSGSFRSKSPSSYSSSSYSKGKYSKPYKKYPSSPRYRSSSPRTFDRNFKNRSFSDRKSPDKYKDKYKDSKSRPSSSTQQVTQISQNTSPYDTYDFDTYSSHVPQLQTLQVPQQVSPVQTTSQSNVVQQPQVTFAPSHHQQSHSIQVKSQGNPQVKDISNFSVKDTLSNLKVQMDLPHLLSQSQQHNNSFQEFAKSVPDTVGNTSQVNSVQTSRRVIPTFPVHYLWHIPLLIKDRPLKGMLDTGSQPSMISLELCSQLGITSLQKTSNSYVAANSNTLTHIGMVKLPVQLSDTLEVAVNFVVVKDCNFSVLLGLDFIEHTEMVLYRKKVQVKDPVTHRYVDVPLLREPLQYCTNSIFTTISQRSFSFWLLLFGFLVSLPRLFYAFLQFLYYYFFKPARFALFQLLHPPWYVHDPVPDCFPSPLCFLAFLSCLIVLLFILFSFRSKRKLYCLATMQRPQYTRTAKHKLQPKVIRKLKLHRHKSNDPLLHIYFPKFPVHKRYQLILCDAPWHYNNISPLTPSYRTLTFQQLKQLPVRVIADTTCIFLYWTTGPMLSKATALARHYGFRHLTVLHSWRKINIDKSPYISKTSTANLTQPNTEYLIVAYKGIYKQLMHSNISPIKQELSTLALPHSQKPSQVYTTLERLFKVHQIPCIELFARTQSHPFLDLYGDAIQNYFQPSQKVLKQDSYFSMTVGQITPVSTNTSVTVSPQTIPYLSQFSTETRSRLQNLLRYTPFIDSELQQCITFLVKHLDIFAWHSHEVGKMSNVYHSITLVPNAVPKAFPPYRLSPQDREFVEKEILELLRLGYIIRGVSPWAAPVLVVPKEGGKRMVIDFRHLNAQTVKQHWPLPTFEDFLAYLVHAKVLSKLDLRSGFLNQLYATEADEQLTSFVCHLGQFVCKRLWFGLCNAPSSFQRGIMDALGDLVFKCVIVYIDDILIFSSSFTDHIQHLQAVFQRLAQANVRLHPSKCQLFTKTCDFLGHTIDNGTIRPKLKRHNLLQTMSPPTTRTQVKCFLGLISYYRRFVQNFSSIAQPLNILLQKDTPFQWNSSQQQAFDTLREKLLSLPTLYLPSASRQFCLTTDFSTKGLGAVLSQLDSQQQDFPIAFISRTLNKFERRYGSYEGEVLAVMFALSKFRHFLLGQHFLLYTDNKALQQVLHNKSPSPKIHRWLLQLSDFTFTVVHRKGSENINADALSRLAPLEQQINTVYTPKHVRFYRRYRVHKYSQNSFPKLYKRYRNFLKQSFISPPVLKSILHKTQSVSSVSKLPEPYKPIDLTDIACDGCQKTTPEHMLLCERCGHGFHKFCFSPCPSFVPSDFYFCTNCLQFIETEKPSDPIFNFSLLQYVKSKSFPSQLSQSQRESIARLASSFKYEDSQYLIVFGNSFRIFPTPLQRTQILYEMHNNAGHPGIRKTLGLIQTKFHWPSIRQTVASHIASCTLCLAKRADYRESQQLMPLPKGETPFSYWSIDLLTNLPRSLEGYQHILICICSFSKWPELLPLKSKESIEIAHCIHRDIICRYGKPLAFRSDNGNEFKDSLSTLFHYLGIAQQRTNVNRPRANGQAERFVQTLVSLLRNAVHQNSLQLSDWPQCLPTVCYTLRMTPSVLNQSPFQIIHGMLPRPIAALDEVSATLPSPEFSQEQVDSYCKLLEQIQSKCFQKTSQRLQLQASLSKASYDTKTKKSSYIFSKHDLVFKSVGPRQTKLQMPSEGPFVITDFVNDSTAVVYDPSTKQASRASVYNLLPVPSIKTQQELSSVLDQPNFEYRKRNYTRKTKQHTSNTHKPKRKPGRPKKNLAN